jgi:hypothetical protein
MMSQYSAVRTSFTASNNKRQFFFHDKRPPPNDGEAFCVAAVRIYKNRCEGKNIVQEPVGLYGPKRKFGSLRADFGSFEDNSRSY